MPFLSPMPFTMEPILRRDPDCSPVIRELDRDTNPYRMGFVLSPSVEDIRIFLRGRRRSRPCSSSPWLCSLCMCRCIRRKNRRSQTSWTQWRFAGLTGALLPQLRSLVPAPGLDRPFRPLAPALGRMEKVLRPVPTPPWHSQRPTATGLPLFL